MVGDSNRFTPQKAKDKIFIMLEILTFYLKNKNEQ